MDLVYLCSVPSTYATEQAGLLSRIHDKKNTLPKKCNSFKDYCIEYWYDRKFNIVGVYNNIFRSN